MYDKLIDTIKLCTVKLWVVLTIYATMLTLSLLSPLDAQVYINVWEVEICIRKPTPLFNFGIVPSGRKIIIAYSSISNIGRRKAYVCIILLCLSRNPKQQQRENARERVLLVVLYKTEISVLIPSTLSDESVITIQKELREWMDWTLDRHN